MPVRAPLHTHGPTIHRTIITTIAQTTTGLPFHRNLKTVKTILGIITQDGDGAPITIVIIIKEGVADKCREAAAIQIINRRIKGEETTNININLTNFHKTFFGIKISPRIITPPIRVMIRAVTLNSSNREMK